MRPILARCCVAALLVTFSVSSLTTACGHGVVESRPLTADFDGYRSGAVEVEPPGIEGGPKGGEQFVAYLQAELKKNGILEPLPLDRGAQLVVRVRAASNNSGEDDVRVLVDFIDGRSRQTIGQITVGANGLEKPGAAMRSVGDQIVAYMRSHRRTSPTTKANRDVTATLPSAAAATEQAGGVATSGSCKTTCTPDATSALPPEDLTRLAEAFQPMLKDVRVCLDHISAQAINPALILRFESQPGQLTQLKLDAGGYDEMTCVQDARSRTPVLTVARASSVRCDYRCAR
jgi:hypothetical protein